VTSVRAILQQVCQEPIRINLIEIVAGANHLNKKQKLNLLALLTKYEDLFDGTLGEWKTPPVEFELKEGGSTSL